MNKNKRIIKVFLDDAEEPFAQFQPPVKFVFDSSKIPDGKHELKIVAKSSNNIEGIKVIPFEVKNGPDITVVGLRSNEIVTNQIPITINAYGSEREDIFEVEGSENPRGIPIWLWISLISFILFGAYFAIRHWNVANYESYF